MGGLCSSGFTVDESVSGRDEVSLTVFNDIGLSRDDLNQFWNIFAKIDTRKCGTVTKTELFSFFKIEENELTTKLFRSFDVDNSHELDFCEFTVSFWNYLTMDAYYLPTFVFYTFDDDDNGSLDFFEVKAVVETIHCQAIDKNIHLKQILSDLQDLTPVDQRQFRRFCAENQSLYQPLVALQLNLQDKMLGRAFWERMSDARQKVIKQLKPDYAYWLTKYMKAEVEKKKAARKYRKIQQKREDAIQKIARDREENSSQAPHSAIFEFFRPRMMMPSAQPPPPSASGTHTVTPVIRRQRHMDFTELKQCLSLDLSDDADVMPSPVAVSRKQPLLSSRRPPTPNTERLHTPDTGRDGRGRSDSVSTSDPREYLRSGSRESERDAPPRTSSRERRGSSIGSGREGVSRGSSRERNSGRTSSRERARASDMGGGIGESRDRNSRTGSRGRTNSRGAETMEAQSSGTGERPRPRRSSRQDARPHRAKKTSRHQQQQDGSDEGDDMESRYSTLKASRLRSGDSSRELSRSSSQQVVPVDLIELPPLESNLTAQGRAARAVRFHV